jgi:hypothetical protein
MKNNVCPSCNGKGTIEEINLGPVKAVNTGPLKSRPCGRCKGLGFIDPVRDVEK